MNKKKVNHAFIDGANLHKGINELGWRLDYIRFRKWLTEKYLVDVAYLFMGHIPEHKKLYSKLEKSGFTLVFKETTKGMDGKTKGNCDAELVLSAASGSYENHFKKAVIVTGDGDFACLVSFLLKKGKLKSLIAPNKQKSSYLLRRIQGPLVFLNSMQNKLGQKKPLSRTEP